MLLCLNHDLLSPSGEPLGQKAPGHILKYISTLAEFCCFCIKLTYFISMEVF